MSTIPVCLDLILERADSSLVPWVIVEDFSDYPEELGNEWCDLMMFSKQRINEQARRKWQHTKTGALTWSGSGARIYSSTNRVSERWSPS